MSQETTGEPRTGCGGTSVPPAREGDRWPQLARFRNRGAKTTSVQALRACSGAVAALGFLLLENENDTRPAAGASASVITKSGHFRYGKPVSILPENAPNSGSVWIISPSNSSTALCLARSTA